MGQEQHDSPSGIQSGGDTTIHGDFAGRDIDKSTHTYVPAPPQLISIRCTGGFDGPQFRLDVYNDSAESHLFSVALYSVTGDVQQSPINKQLQPLQQLKWLGVSDTEKWRVIGPRQHGVVEVATTSGTTTPRDAPSHTTVKFNAVNVIPQIARRLITHVEWGSDVGCEIEVNSDGPMEHLERSTWNLAIGTDGKPSGFTQ